MLAAVTAACDRLVHASVTDAARRLAQARTIGLLFAGSFLLAGAMATLFPPQLGEGATLTAICGTFGFSGLGVLILSLAGRAVAIEIAALASSAVAVAAIVAAAGGLASPVSFCLIALPLEAYWIRRTRGAALLGVAAAFAVLPLQALLGVSVFFSAAATSAWHWLIPIAYAATVAPRLATWLETATSGAAGAQEPLLDMIDGAVLRLTAGGEVTDASRQSREMFGVAPELLLFGGLFERIHVADRVAYMSALADLRRGAPSRRVEVRLRRACSEDGRIAGEYRPFAMEMMRSETAAGGVVAIVRRNDEMADLRSQLDAATRSADGVDFAKSRFLAAVSHELRTPLNAIIGFSDMLLQGIFGGFQHPKQKEYVGLVRESGHHLLAVVNSMLDVSRIESGAYATHPESFRFKDAVDMCHSMLCLQACEKKLEITAEVAPEIGEIHADRRAIQQILINLVSNAIKFTPEYGRVAIGARRIGSRLHFWVSDTGIGMSADELARIGKPFMQVQNDYTRRFDGAGLGLSLVKGLVKLHDGTMSIDSETGGGTTVNISLPTAGPIVAPPVEPAAIVKMPASRIKEEFDGSLRKTA